MEIAINMEIRAQNQQKTQRKSEWWHNSVSKYSEQLPEWSSHHKYLTTKAELQSQHKCLQPKTIPYCLRQLRTAIGL